MSLNISIYLNTFKTEYTSNFHGVSAMHTGNATWDFYLLVWEKQGHIWKKEIKGKIK